MMQKIARAVLAIGLSVGFAATAQAAGEVVLGDSLGVGVKIASGRTGPARLSVHIRNDQVLGQINSVTPGSTAFLVLGTNDAAGTVRGLEKYIDNIVRAADRRSLKLVWIGPPCVRKAWDKNSRELDGMLASRLASTSVKYVSIRDESLCNGSHGGDGVHMTMKGYHYMWNKARIAAGLPEEASAVRIAESKPRTDKPKADRLKTDRAKAVTLASADATPRVQKRKHRVAAARTVQTSSGSLFSWFRRGH